MKREMLIVVLLIGMIIPVMASSSFFEGGESFEVDSALLKLTIKEGENASKTLKITSYVDDEFRITADGLDFVEVKDGVFFLKEGEARKVELVFDSEGLEPGVYFGEIVVINKQTSKIPVIMEVETREILFDGNINVPLEYVNVYSGENIVIENKIFNLENIGSQSIEVSYLVRSFDGKTIFSEEENIVVESQLLNTKVISIPEDSDGDSYVISSVVRYKNYVGTSSYFFRVKERTSYEIDDSFFMWIIIGLLIGLVFFIIYYTRKRDFVLLGLQRDYRREVNRNLNIIKEKEEGLKVKGAKRKVALEKIRVKHKEKVKAVRKIYRTRVKTVKVLQRAKKEGEVSQKLREWKKAGYNVEGFLESGIINKKKAVGKHKREGYNL